MNGEAPPELTTERYAAIAAQVDVNKDRPRAEVLAPFGFSEAEWEVIVAAWTQRIVDEIKARSGSGLPVEKRYPLAAGYAKAYATAVKEAKEQRARETEEAEAEELEPEEIEDEATMRIPPDAPRDTPFSVLGASNRAALKR